MKSVPRCIRGPFRSALTLMLQEIVAGHEVSDRFRVERGWKGFLMLPRLLLHRRCRGGLISRDKLKERFKLFNAGRWFELLAASVKCDDEAAAASRWKRRRSVPNDLEHRVNRAMSKIQLGELTAGRQALEGADLAPGTPDTLQHLRARPQVSRDPIPEDQGHIPQHHSSWTVKFGANLRSEQEDHQG